MMDTTGFNSEMLMEDSIISTAPLLYQQEQEVLN